MAILTMLVGIPSSGKSTWAAQHSNKSLVVSSDGIRKELYGDESIQGDGQKVFELVHKRIYEALSSGQDCTYDATNLKRKDRINFLKEMKKRAGDCAAVAQVFATPFDECCATNIKRERVVPSFVMERMYKNFTVPHRAEGFDVVKLCARSSNAEILAQKLLKDCELSHDNPHHSLTVGNHCIAAHKYIQTHRKEIREDVGYYWSYCLSVAAIYHDEGKRYCKTFLNKKGEKDDKAHFYNHENVGAYDFLAYAGDKFNANPLDIALLINLHMIHYGDETYKARMKKLYGEEIWKALEWLNKADEAAH